MVILDRLVHIRNLILHGAKVMCNTACNPINSIERVRISVDPNVRIEASFQQTSLRLIDSLIQAAGAYHVADRGHRHSGGISVVTFLINYGLSPKPHKAWATSCSSKKVRLNIDAEAFVCEAPVSKQIAFDSLSLKGDWRAIPPKAWGVIYDRFGVHRKTLAHEGHDLERNGMSFVTEALDATKDDIVALQREHDMAVASLLARREVEIFKAIDDTMTEHVESTFSSLATMFNSWPPFLEQGDEDGEATLKRMIMETCEGFIDAKASDVNLEQQGLLRIHAKCLIDRGLQRLKDRICSTLDANADASSLKGQ